MSITPEVHKLRFDESMQALLYAHWNLNYDQWRERAGFHDDDYAKLKWELWQQLAASLRVFDTNTLYRICYGTEA